MVGVLFKEAYTVAVMDEIAIQTNRILNISAIHAVLKRLEDKGLVTSEMGGATKERGGRKKRIYMLTMLGKKLLDEVMVLRNQLHKQIPSISYNFTV